MKASWFLIVLISAFPASAPGLQASTPQAALEEIATADKPEMIARHLPEPVRKSIEDLPRPARQKVMNQLMEMKSAEFNGWRVRRAHDSDAWEIVDEEGNSKGKVTLGTAFISGLDAMLPLQFDNPGGAQMFIVTMHLDGDEWRIDAFGPWEKSDPGVNKLLHEPTEMEKNDAAAKDTLFTIRRALGSYASRFPGYGYPHTLRPLTVTIPHPAQVSVPPLLDTAFAEDPAVVKGYEFRYVLTMPGNGAQEWGKFEITAGPVEFGKTGSRQYFMDENGNVYCTTQNRPATEDDGGCGDDDSSSSGDLVID